MSSEECAPPGLAVGEVTEGVAKESGPIPLDSTGGTAGGKPVDIVFIFVHGASFSSKLFDSNLKEFLASLTDVNQDWFWELDLNYHVEMIDWKSCMTPYQFKSISRCMPVESMYDTDDEAGDQTPADDVSAGVTEAAAEFVSLTSLTEQAPPTAPQTMMSGISRLFKWNSQDSAAPQRSSLTASSEGAAIEDQVPAETAAPGSDEVAAATEVVPVTEPAPNSRRGSRSRKGCFVADIGDEPENVKEFRELQKKHGLRVYFSNTVVDVMFYLTPRFGGYMTSQVGRLLNQRVRALRESPCGRFNHSEIVLVGHSLGSVILYELLAERPLRAKVFDDVDQDETSLFPDQHLPSQADLVRVPIDFVVKNVFFWGSPLSSFLVLKNDKSLKPDGALTQKRGSDFRLFNIFHRSDPIATRIEPIFYNDRDYIPPEVRIPSYNHGDVLRRGIELVAKNSVRAAATMLVNKLFSSGQGAPDGTEDWVQRLLPLRRYSLPDPLERKRRFGLLTEPSPGGLSSPRASQGGTESVGEELTEVMLMAKPRFAVTLEEGSDERLPSHIAQSHRPWTVRQLALNCTRKLRKKACVKILEKLELIQAERRREVCLKLFSAIDLEFDSLLNSVCSGAGINKVDPIRYEDEPWLDDRRVSDVLLGWQQAALKRELQLTANQLRREIVKSLNCQYSEVEREGPGYFPFRLDFSLTGGLQEMLIAPLGLLQSHLKYWSDRDTCLFMLKMITGFHPLVSRTRRDVIVNEAKKSKERIFKLVQKLVR